MAGGGGPLLDEIQQGTPYQEVLTEDLRETTGTYHGGSQDGTACRCSCGVEDESDRADPDQRGTQQMEDYQS